MPEAKWNVYRAELINFGTCFVLTREIFLCVLACVRVHSCVCVCVCVCDVNIAYNKQEIIVYWVSLILSQFTRSTIYLCGGMWLTGAVGRAYEHVST